MPSGKHSVRIRYAFLSITLFLAACDLPPPKTEPPPVPIPEPPLVPYKPPKPGSIQEFCMNLGPKIPGYCAEMCRKMKMCRDIK